MASAFDDEEEYELTELGKQLVHYTMNEIVPRIAASSTEKRAPAADTSDDYPPSRAS